MSAHIDGIEYAVLAVADLTKAKETYQRLGFTTTPRRRMVGNNATTARTRSSATTKGMHGGGRIPSRF